MNFWNRNSLAVVLIVLMLSAGNTLDAQDFYWIKQIGGPDHDASYTIVLDDAANIYVCGTFAGTVVFGAGEVLTSVADPVGDPFAVPPNNNYDMFLAKYDRQGELLWVKQAGGPGGRVVGLGVDLDVSGNILVAGSFSATVTFEPGEDLTSLGSLDTFLAKYDNDGNLMWVREAGGPDYNYTQGVGVDGSGGSCIGGFFVDSMRFGPTDILDATDRGDEIFLAKYDSNGQFLWARSIGDTGRDAGYDVTADEAGNCYVSGEISGTVTVDSGGPNETTLVASDATDVFVAKYDSSGVLQWAKIAVGMTVAGMSCPRELGRRLSVDPSGNVHMAGYFCSSPAIFGFGEVNETPLDSAGDLDIFVARYDANGHLLWAKRAGGPGRDQGVDVAWDKLGNTYLTGRFDDEAVFGPGDPNETTLYLADSSGLYDIFTAKYNSAGELLWVRGAGGAADDHGGGLDVDYLGDVYVTGSFASIDAVFGNVATLVTTGGVEGIYDSFLATVESTALEKIDFLINEVRLLEASGAINSGQANWLVRTLGWSRGALERGWDIVSIIFLRIFAAQVTNYVGTGVLLPAEAQPLLNAVDIIVEQINRT